MPLIIAILSLIAAALSVIANLGLFRRNRLLGGEKLVLEDERDHLKDQLRKIEEDNKTAHPARFVAALFDLKDQCDHDAAIDLSAQYMNRQTNAVVEACLTRADAALIHMAEDGEAAIAQAEAYLAQARLFARNHPALRAMEDQIKTLRDDPITLDIDPHMDVETLRRIGDNLMDKAQFTAAQVYLEAARTKARTEHGTTTLAYLSTCNSLGWLFRRVARYDRAEHFLQTATNGYEKIGQAQSSDYAVTLGNLANLYSAIGQYKKAEPLYQKAIEIGKATIGANHPDYAKHLNNLAGLYHDIGQYDKADPLYQKAIEINKATIGENHPDYATSLNNLASLYYDMGQYDKAELLFQKAIEIDKATRGENHPSYAKHLGNLANLYRDIGQYDKAEPLYQKAIPILEAALGPDHPRTVAAQENYDALKQKMTT